MRKQNFLEQRNLNLYWFFQSVILSSLFFLIIFLSLLFEYSIYHLLYISKVFFYSRHHNEYWATSSFQGQSSQVHRGSGIHILKINPNFYILLVWLRGANPENFSTMALFVQNLWPFEYFRVCLIFLVMQIFSILGNNYQKFSNLQSRGRYSLKYMPRLL